MGRQKFFWSVGLAVFFVAGILLSYSSAQNVQVLDLSSQNLRDRLYASGFIAAQPVPSWGKIVGTKNQVFNLTAGEIVFIKIDSGKNGKAGGSFCHRACGKEVFPPGAKKKMGDLVIVPGEIVIVSAREDLVTAKIEKSYSHIFRRRPDPFAPSRPPGRHAHSLPQEYRRFHPPFA